MILFFTYVIFHVFREVRGCCWNFWVGFIILWTKNFPINFELICMIKETVYGFSAIQLIWGEKGVNGESILRHATTRGNYILAFLHELCHEKMCYQNVIPKEGLAGGVRHRLQNIIYEGSKVIFYSQCHTQRGIGGAPNPSLGMTMTKILRYIFSWHGSHLFIATLKPETPILWKHN